MAGALVLAGCASGNVQSEPTRASESTTASPQPSATATPSPMPTVILPTSAPQADPAPEPVPAQPSIAPALGPNDVDPAGYTSHAVDTVNVGNTLPGVAFTTADGHVICGIFGPGHLATMPGTASCTVDTYRQVFPQPSPTSPPFVQSVMVDPAYGPAGLYPDWFAQPKRSIPVLTDGKSIRFEGTTCTAQGGQVKCIVDSTQRGFLVDTAAYSMF
jgi:hypothetical protein